MAVTGFFRALGGAVGAAVLGAVFASRVGQAGAGTLALAHGGRSEVIAGVHAVFLVAAPLALIALLIVLALKEVPLRGPDRPAQRPPESERSAPLTRQPSPAKG
jgi:MFS family permease